MKPLLFNISIYLYLLLCASNNAHCQQSDSINEKPYKYRIIFSASLFLNVKDEDVAAITKVLTKELIKEQNSGDDFEIIFCHSINDINKALEQEFDILWISQIEKEQINKKYKLEPELINEVNGTYGDVYYLITNKNENRNDLCSLKNCSINIFSKADGLNPSLWLEYLLRKDNFPGKKKFFSKINFDYKANNIVLPVYFNKTNAAVITKSAYNLLCELNPSIKKELAVIDSSKPLVNGIFYSDPRNKNEKKKRSMFNYLKNLQKGSYSQQMKDMYKLERVVPFKPEYLNTFWEVYKK